MHVESRVGRVRTGLGDFAGWMERLAEDYRALLGVALVPGTLNVELDGPWSMPEERLVLEPDPARATVRVFVVPCRIEGVDAFVLRTEANEQGRGDHPSTIVEIAARVHLRTSLGLRDGDPVELELPAPGR